MQRIHTHYDNLKVARDAPPEIVKAAYRTLSQKYHPDRNPDNSEAARIMTLINASYSVLIDPKRRREHDEWVAQQEVLNAAQGDAPHPQPAPPSAKNKHTPDRVAPGLASRARRVEVHIAAHWRGYLLLVCAIFIAYSTYNDKTAPPPPGPKPYTAVAPSDSIVAPALRASVPEAHFYVRPLTAPNGIPWPENASLLPGFPRLNADGNSTVTVDNSQNESDVHVKLVSLSGPRAYPVRVFYIPARGKFTLKKLTPGSYDIRYRDLNSGGLSRTESFDLTEKPIYEHGNNGIEYTTLTFSLYKVRDGNARTYPLAESEF